MLRCHLDVFDFKRFTVKRYLNLHNEQRLNLGEMVQRRWGVVLSVVLMFVDIVRRGERTTHFPSSHPPPWWRGDSWEHGESRSERRGSNRLRKHSDYNDNDTCAEQMISAELENSQPSTHEYLKSISQILSVPLHPESVVSIIRVVVTVTSVVQVKEF